jgi:hypothetical protein
MILVIILYSKKKLPISWEAFLLYKFDIKFMQWATHRTEPENVSTFDIHLKSFCFLFCWDKYLNYYSKIQIYF